MLFIKVRIHRILAVLLVVVALAAVSIPPAPIGVAPVSANSRCDEHYEHSHGAWFWRRIDRYIQHGWGIDAGGYMAHWVIHTNSGVDWCPP